MIKTREDTRKTERPFSRRWAALIRAICSLKLPARIFDTHTSAGNTSP